MISVNKNIIPFFSVVITSYQRGYIIKRAIESLINQEEEDWEAVIVDDGSNDNTFDAVKNYCDNDIRFRYIYQQNRGQSSAKNCGILASSGLYVTFLDSDDEFEKEHLQYRKNILRQNPEVELLHGGVKIIGDEYVPDMYNPTQKIHLRDCVIGGTFFIYKSKAVEIGGFPNINYGDDTAFFNSAVENGLVIAKIDKPTYIYHRNSVDSLCNKTGY